MSKLKNLILSTVLIASATFIQSCSDDENIEYITEIGTVSYISNNESEQTQVNGDYNGLSNILNKNALKYAQSDSVGQRILYTYIIEADNKSAALPQNAKQSIKIYDIYKVLTKKMDTYNPDTQTDNFGNDNISINWMYISSAHLNIQFTIRRSSSSIAHRISLVALEGSKPDENGVLHLELRHNKFNDDPYINNIGYVSYTLESIPGYKDGTLKKLIITCKNSDSITESHEIVVNKDSSKGTMQKINSDENSSLFYK